MTPQQAALILTVSIDGLSRDDVLTAFRAAVKRNHPDVSAEYHVGIDKLIRARKILLEFIDKGGGQPLPACGGCGGTGRVSGRFGSVTCPRCGGKGHR